MRHRNPLTPQRLFGLFLLALLCAAPASAAETISARFLGALDGDSLRVVYQGGTLEVRLIGVDAPEYKQEYSRKAKEFTVRFCFNKTLQLEYDKERKDRYGRHLAYVYHNGRMLNRELVRAGLAIPIRVKPNTRYFEQFLEAEKDARENRRGFWIKGGLDMTPAQWRKTHPRK
ncbi:MAG: thermonuclease family protein [Pseudodesulfovibrio sp.]|jgi:micrococcal nuclease|uniref:Nuclease n=1 Tax=Pseudodesulfovibrio indicus TaxID=1716143 RepID=A0A126QK79_9BACT|nr:thermonuclease family protein [Pseudodesulfovibrio indicus]AMK10159.1 nuclease [Pseudodesulfovibrio indicus]TDT87866.1 micrococcal nuclease [Pseudodesulfovibrio indicus]